jgi:hypothetical protein
MPETIPPWAQPGVTDVPAARDFLAALAAPDTIVLSSSDGDVGYTVTPRGQAFRGHGASVSRNVIAATPPPEDLLAYHRTLGLGPEHVFCPANASARTRLARLVLEDDALCARLRADRSLARILVAFKDAAAEALIARVGLAPAYCTPPSSAYETANDKLAFADAGPRYGFDTVPMRLAADAPALDAAVRALADVYGEGCVLRLRRGASGRHIHRARTLRAARRIWRRLRAHGEVLVSPYVPPAHVLRNIATHGVVSDGRFAPFVFSEQLLHGSFFRGGHVPLAWDAAEVAAVRRGLGGIARWLADLGYTDAPAGIDGFLVRGADGPRFLALDPNIRLTGTMIPWAIVAALTDAIGRPFLWQVEWLPMLGAALTLPRLRRRLGADLVDAAALERGGILPAFLATRRLGPVGSSGLWALLLAHDAGHLDHLRARVRGLALMVR